MLNSISIILTFHTSQPSQPPPLSLNTNLTGRNSHNNAIFFFQQAQMRHKSKLIKLFFTLGILGGTGTYSVPLRALTPSRVWGVQAPEIVGGQGRRGPHVWEMMWQYVTWMVSTRQTGIHGERVWGVARCCLPRSPGQPQHRKYQNRIWWWWCQNHTVWSPCTTQGSCTDDIWVSIKPHGNLCYMLCCILMITVQMWL